MIDTPRRGKPRVEAGRGLLPTAGVGRPPVGVESGRPGPRRDTANFLFCRVFRAGTWRVIDGGPAGTWCFRDRWVGEGAEATLHQH